jgi:hypothetical protein
VLAPQTNYGANVSNHTIVYWFVVLNGALTFPFDSRIGILVTKLRRRKIIYFGAFDVVPFEDIRYKENSLSLFRYTLPKNIFSMHVLL